MPITLSYLIQINTNCYYGKSKLHVWFKCSITNVFFFPWALKLKQRGTYAKWKYHITRHTNKCLLEWKYQEGISRYKGYVDLYSWKVIHNIFLHGSKVHYIQDWRNFCKSKKYILPNVIFWLRSLTQKIPKYIFIVVCHKSFLRRDFMRIDQSRRESR